jgi:hypothetical protein
MVYINPHANAGRVLQLDRYSFGLDNCTNDPGTIYVLSGETPPLSQVHYSLFNFEGFNVYIPTAASQ